MKKSIRMDDFLNLVLAFDRGTSSVSVLSCDTGFRPGKCLKGQDHSPEPLKAEGPASDSSLELIQNLSHLVHRAPVRGLTLEDQVFEIAWSASVMLMDF